MPARSCPGPRAARGDGWSSRPRMAKSAAMTATYDAALMRKTGPVLAASPGGGGAGGRGGAPPRARGKGPREARAVRRRVEEKAGPGPRGPPAEPGDQKPRHRRSDDPRRVEGGAVEADGVGEVVLADH